MELFETMYPRGIKPIKIQFLIYLSKSSTAILLNLPCPNALFSFLSKHVSSSDQPDVGTEGTRTVPRHCSPVVRAALGFVGG